MRELSPGKKIMIGIVGFLTLVTILGAGEEPKSNILSPTPATTNTTQSEIRVNEEAPVKATEVKTETETEEVAFETVTQNDSGLASGQTRLVTAGVNGVRTLSYRVTYVDGEATERELISSEITKQPVNEVIRRGTKTANNCHPSYSGRCVPIASDVDCAGGSGNGPAYVSGPVNVIGADVYALDADDDGLGCE